MPSAVGRLASGGSVAVAVRCGCVPIRIEKPKFVWQRWIPLLSATSGAGARAAALRMDEIWALRSFVHLFVRLFVHSKPETAVGFHSSSRILCDPRFYRNAQRCFSSFSSLFGRIFPMLLT